jgi:hypothetical protein
MKTLAAVFAILLAVPAAAGTASGRIVAEDGSPVPHAQVCEFVEDKPPRCVSADQSGTFRMEATTKPTLVVRARGFVAATIDAAPLNAPVVLKTAGSLLVSVVDGATKVPLSEGKVMIDTPSGRRLGDSVPFNKSGVRISTLEPGIVFVRATAKGYRPGGPVPAEVVSGSERTVTVPMAKSPKPTH